MSATFDLILRQRERLSPTVSRFIFERTDGAPLPHAAGQFLQLTFDDGQGGQVRRSYSLAGVADGAGPAPVELVIADVPGGIGSTALNALAIGGRVAASGPLGRFTLQASDAPARHVFLATGTGVAPFRAMLAQLSPALGEGRVQMALLQGARTRADLLFAGEFLALAERLPGFQYIPCLSRETPADLPEVRSGYVQDQLAGLSLDPTRDLAWLCGNPGMVDAGFAALRAAGFGMARLRREKYLPG